MPERKNDAEGWNDLQGIKRLFMENIKNWIKTG